MCPKQYVNHLILEEEKNNNNHISSNILQYLVRNSLIEFVYAILCVRRASLPAHFSNAYAQKV